jgi:mannose-6-phosphate isomerase-like protein (cupin superfamily)
MEPIVLLPGDGETITNREARSVVIKAAHELIDVTETRYGPGERGPDPHMHRAHADAFYVLAGELVFGLGPGGAEQVRAPLVTLVLVRAGLVHTIGNEGSVDTRFLNIHAPSERFVESLRIRRDGGDYDGERFDSFEPPVDGGRPASDAVVRSAGSGEAISLGGSSALFKAEGGDGDGAFSLTETTLAPGFPGPVPHVHEMLADSFYVLEGTLTVRLGAEEIAASAGSFAFVPPGNVHTFSNPSAAPTRMLNLMAPGGFEQYLKEAARAMPTDAPPDPAVMAEIASRYDFRPAEAENTAAA